MEGGLWSNVRGVYKFCLFPWGFGFTFVFSQTFRTVRSRLNGSNGTHDFCAYGGKNSRSAFVVFVVRPGRRRVSRLVGDQDWQLHLLDCVGLCAMPATLAALVRARGKANHQQSGISAFHKRERFGGGDTFAAGEIHGQRDTFYNLSDLVIRKKRIRSPSVEKSLGGEAESGSKGSHPSSIDLRRGLLQQANGDPEEGDAKSAKEGDDSPEKWTTPSKAEQDAINREEIVLDSEEEPEQEGWKLWHFVKGLSPKKPSLLNIFGGWRSKAEAEVSEEVPPSKVAKLRGGGRTTLPKRNGSTARPNIRKVIGKMAKNKNYLNYILGKKKALEADFDANSSRAAKESRRATVKKILASAGSKSKRGKIDSEDIKTVAAVLKDANYKSAHLYLGDLKLMHIEGDHDWTPYLERIYKQCKLSTARGIGPRKKAIEVPEDVWAEEAKGEGVEKLKIHLPQRLFAMGVQWMMREIEIAALRTSNVHFNPKNKTVTLQWLESKMDQSGKSFTRVLQCLCVDGCDLRCPYENLKVIVQKARELYGVEEEDPWLATTKAGMPATKQQVISAWQCLFGRAVTGHSTRRSGALQYIHKGWSVSQVAFLERWKSNIILEYADEALQSIPVNISGNFNTANANHAVIQQASVPGDLALQQEIVLELKEEVKALRTGNVKVKLKLEKMQQEWEEKQQTACERELPLLVKALKSETVHYNASQVLCSPPFTWRTVCGWHYHSGAYTFVEPPHSVTCQKCLSFKNTSQLRAEQGG